MKIVSRRRFLVAGALGSASAVVAGRRHVTAAPSDTTLWRLNPDWGTPLTTETGSSTKSRCRGAACHNAAPNRFFLTRADALASRLHPCCLAQPEPIALCVDLNALMPYYSARLGGVDGRCPELPPDLRAALYAGVACAAGLVATTDAGTPTTTTPANPATPTTTDPAGGSSPTTVGAAPVVVVPSTQPAGVADDGGQSPDSSPARVLPATK